MLPLSASERWLGGEVFGDFEMPVNNIIIGDPRDKQTQPAFFRLLDRNADPRCAVARRDDAHGLCLDLDRHAVGPVRANIKAVALLDRLIKLK